MATTKKYISLDKLSLYDEKIKKVIADGDAAALASAKTYADGLAGNYETAGAAAAVQTKLDEEVARAKAAEEANAGLANAAQSDVDALETYVGTFTGSTATTVVGYINEKSQNAFAWFESAESIAYQGLDKAEALETYVGTIPEGSDASTVMEYVQKRDQGLLDLIEDVENAVAAIEDDYLKAADKTELQGKITTNADAIAAIKEDVDAFFADADMTESAKDTLKELQEYIASDETGAAAMAASIKQNSDAIDVVEGKVATIEGNITTLQGEDTAIKGRLDAIESAIGESGSVADDIATAKQEAIDAAAADATSKANTAESNAKTYADGLNTSMNTRVEALEAVDHSHANQTVLDGITSDKVTAWDGAVTKAHEHSNKTVLDGITEAKVIGWNNAQTTAQDYADSLNSAMDTRVTAVETGLAAMVEASEEDINGLFV